MGARAEPWHRFHRPVATVGNVGFVRRTFWRASLGIDIMAVAVLELVEG